MKVLVPHPDAIDQMGGVPAGVELLVWPGSGPLPPGSEDVEFYVPPFLGTGDAVAAMVRLPKLRVVQLLTAGAEALLGSVPPGVTLCRGGGVHDPSTAEWVVTVILAALRDIPRFVRAQDEGRWDYAPTDVLAGKTVLIVGAGSIGAAVERRLAGFEVQVRRAARRAREGVTAIADVPDLLPEVDVIVVLVPLTAGTRGLVDAAFLRRMRDGALLVNGARGAVVDTEALVVELSTGRLRAALDVTDPEPLPPGHPLWSAPGLLVTPHVAGSTPLTVPRAYALVRRQLERYQAGEPLDYIITGEY
ncbi:MAG: 2-hydroxyacid dehydrogenase [Frankiaceae bacterium]|jgi:phosphoglycerate dehydrogenase-like enzyme